MKVLFLTNVPSPYRVDFFNELGKIVDLTVIFERNNAKSRNKEWMSDNFKYFKFYFLKGIQYGDDGIISFQIKKYLKEGYDIVCFGNYHTATSIIASKYCIKKKIPYCLSIDGIFKHEQENKLKLKIKKSIFSHAEFFVTTGKYSEEVIQFYGGKNCYIYPFTSIHEDYVLSEPISLEEKKELKKKLGLNEKTILFVGQVVPRKGIDILFQMYQQLKQYKLVMIGGTLNESYEALRRELKLDIEIIPFLNSKELEEYYLASDVFVLPTREDQWGLVVNEALAKGLPVVSTNRCLACFEMIQNNGKIVNVENVEEYVHEIKTILEMPLEQYQKLQKNAIDVAKEYTIEKMAQRHIEIFNEVLKKR